MHDPRLGRFFAVDPLEAKYPWYAPYQFSGNKVIAWVELEGLEEKGTSSTESSAEHMIEYIQSRIEANEREMQNIEQSLKKTEQGIQNELQGAYKELLRMESERDAFNIQKTNMARDFAAVDHQLIYYTPGREYPLDGYSSSGSIDPLMMHTGSASASSIFEPFTEIGQEKLVTGLEGIGMSKDAANYTSAGVMFFGSVVLSRKVSYLGSAKTNSRAFFSGAGTEARAINEGFTTLSQTRAGQNLMKMTEGMPYYPGSQAYNW